MPSKTNQMHFLQLSECEPMSASSKWTTIFDEIHGGTIYTVLAPSQWMASVEFNHHPLQNSGSSFLMKPEWPLRNFVLHTSSTSRKQKFYLSKIDPNAKKICPAYNESLHNTNHLIAYPIKPTHLTFLSLWSDPIEAARLLDLPLSDFGYR